jgi:hypothetical protein
VAHSHLIFAGVESRDDFQGIQVAPDLVWALGPWRRGEVTGPLPNGRLIFLLRGKNFNIPASWALIWLATVHHVNIVTVR